MRAMLPSRFNLSDFFTALAGSLFLYFALLILFSFIPNLEPFFNALHPSLFFIFLYVLQLLVLFLPLWFLVLRHKKITPRDFALVKVPWKKFIFTTFGTYIVYLILAYGISLLMLNTGVEVPGYETQDAYLPFFGQDFWGIGVAILFIVFIGPVLEEILFRGFIYRIFIQRMPLWLGSLLTASLFALMHFQLQNIFPLLILGLFLNFAYQKTGSIWTSIAFHVLNNAMAFGVELTLFFNPDLFQDLSATAAFLYHGLPLF